MWFLFLEWKITLPSEKKKRIREKYTAMLQIVENKEPRGMKMEEEGRKPQDRSHPTIAGAEYQPRGQGLVAHQMAPCLNAVFFPSRGSHPHPFPHLKHRDYIVHLLGHIILCVKIRCEVCKVTVAW